MRTPQLNHQTRRRRSARCPQLQVQKLEARVLLAADTWSPPLGATPMDTGEFMLGRVAITPVLFESNGQIDPSTQDWNLAMVESMLTKVREGVTWWGDTLAALDTVHTLDFVFDESFARDELGNVTAVATPYEPIDRPSNFFSTYVGEFLTAQGYGNAGSIENAIRLFNHDQRRKFNADWAFTIFVVNAANDPDGQFAPGGDFGSAFAFAGGQFFVTPSTRPASTIAHEMGHIFWARDEYPGGGSYTDRRGYYNAQNLNAADNPIGIQEPSIMRGGLPLQQAYDANFSPASTLAMIGWQDLNGNGVFDVLDVPLELNALGTFDPITNTYRLLGTATAVPLVNQNSWGLQSDITLNRISEIQYRLDHGPWLTAAAPDQQVVEFDLQVTIHEPFESIQWRAIDQRIGITSNLVSGTRLLPALKEASILGFAYLDTNGNGTREASESPLASTLVTITTAEGESLPSGSIAARDFAEGELPSVIDGASLTAQGTLLAAEVASFPVAQLDNARVFHAFNRQSNQYTYRWSDRAAFVANLSQPMSRIEVDFIGLGNGSYGRLEAYDASGNLITRATSELINGQATATLTVTSAHANIAQLRFFGHAQTQVALAAVRFNIADQVATDASGSWRIPYLPAGNYRINLEPRKLVHQFDVPSFEFQVADTGIAMTTPLVAAASRVANPRHNAIRAVDVNGDQELTSRDALIVINDLNRNGPRVLGHHEAVGFAVDVNDDGSVTSLDALLVINALARQTFLEGEQANAWDATASSAAADQVLAAWPFVHPPQATGLATSPFQNNLAAEPDARLEISHQAEPEFDSSAWLDSGDYNSNLAGSTFANADTETEPNESAEAASEEELGDSSFVLFWTGRDEVV